MTHDTVHKVLTSTCPFVLVEEKSFATAADKGLAVCCLITHLLAGSFSTPVYICGQRKAISASNAGGSWKHTATALNRSQKL